jgi:hypothetical protein
MTIALAAVCVFAAAYLTYMKKEAYRGDKEEV